MSLVSLVTLVCFCYPCDFCYPDSQVTLVTLVSSYVPSDPNSPNNFSFSVLLCLSDSCVSRDTRTSCVTLWPGASHSIVHQEHLIDTVSLCSFKYAPTYELSISQWIWTLVRSQKVKSWIKMYCVWCVCVWSRNLLRKKSILYLNCKNNKESTEWGTFFRLLTLHIIFWHFVLC